ncbi:MAG TPA: toprim domain-containing protein [Paraburkholderia sp.]
MVHESQAIEEFVDAMAEQDIRVNPADIIADGKLHRIHADGDSKNVKDGWYILHADERPAGKFGHNGKYGYDVSFPWSMRIDRAPMSAEEKRAYREKMEADRARREADERARHAAAAELANRIWDAATPVSGDDHPYLKRKGIQSYGLRIGMWEKVDQASGEVSVVSKNALLVPIWGLGKNIGSLQAILPDDKKLGRDKDYLSGADKRGRFFSIGKPLEHEGKLVILICEGYATGASLHAATGHAVIVAFDAPNLLPVAEAMRVRFPEATIIVCADNDQWTLKPVKNPGLTRANEVREAIGALVAMPEFDASLGVANAAGKVKGPNDFNDLMKLEGDDAVRAVIANTLNPPAVVEVPADVIPPWEDIPGAEGTSVLDAPSGEELPGLMFFESAPSEPAPPAPRADDELDRPTDNTYFRLLGYKDDKYFLFHNESKQVKEITKSDFSENGLLELAPLNWWELHFSGGKQGGINKRAAVNFLIRACIAEGIYDNSRRRGRGAWIDEGRTVFHHGGRLTVDGEMVELENIKSRFAYGIDIALPEPAVDPLSDEDGQKLFQLATRFRWTMPGSAALLAGFAMLAPICGALHWRPHVWLTGGAGCGKSTVLNEYVYPLMNGSSLFAQGNSSEAGIRQWLKNDARPVLFDESESNEEGDIRRIQNVLSLIRQASTESEARTLKGTAGGEAMSFHIRSMFCLASIQVAIKHQADVERLTVMSLRPKREDDNAAEGWTTLKDDLYTTITRDKTIAGRLMRRALNMLPTIQKNIEVFATAAAKSFGSQRDGDQYGTLLAGCWSMICSDEATLEQAEAMIQGFDWSEHRENNETDEAQGALGTLLAALIPHQGARYSVAELIQAVAMEDGKVGVVTKSDAEALLGRHGMKVRETVLLIANRSEQLRSLVAGSPYEADLRGALLRVKGATRNEHKPAKFSGVQAKCITIPLAPILAAEPTSEGQF